MTHSQTAIEEIVSQEALAAFATVNGRCITATISIPEPAHLRPGLNNAVRELEKRLKDSHIGRETADLLLEPFREMATTIETEGDWAVWLALYRSADSFRCFRLQEPVKDMIEIADRFQLRPLLPLVSRIQQFYLLALSQKQVRLFSCTNYRAEEVPLKGHAPQNLNAFLSTKAPDHDLENRSSGGPGTGSMKGVLFGTNADREKHDDYMAHFFREIDKGIHKLLNSGVAPLMLTGVQEEVALYRRISTCKHLMEPAINGSPDGMSPVELHRRALELVRQDVAPTLRRLLRELESKRVSTNFTDILAGAREGRVSDLLVREDAERRDSGGEDLINSAVVETLAHGGRAFALRAAEMPDGADTAAVLRY